MTSPLTKKGGRFCPDWWGSKGEWWWGGGGVVAGETWASTSTWEPVKTTRATFLIMKFLHDKRLVVTVERTSFEELEPVSGTGFTLQEFASVEFEVPVNR